MGSEHRAGGVLTVDLDALVSNWRVLSRRVAPGACAAVVKADAYGLGAARVVPTLLRAGCREIFVAHLDEALALVPLMPAEARLFVLNGVTPGAEAEAAAAGVLPVLNSLPQVTAWSGLARRLGRALPAAIQVDSGMARLGLSPRETVALAATPAHLEGVAVAYVMSHLACADEPGHPANRAQLREFESMRRRLPVAPASLANSSGVFLGAAWHFDLARPGAALYGLNPQPGQPNPMAPVVRLAARVIETREVDAGEGVGYGHSWVAPEPMRLATLSIGYADGWLRSLSGRLAAWTGDRRMPVVGRVSMDSLIVDARSVPESAVQPGALVDLIGRHQDVDAVADAAGTIGYEILTGLGPRLARRYTGG